LNKKMDVSDFFNGPVTIRYDRPTIHVEEFNVDSKADSALSSTRSQKKKLKQTTPVPL